MQGSYQIDKTNQILQSYKKQKLIKSKMQKIKKGLEEKLSLISKIQNNLKIKRFDIKKSSQKNHVQFPNIQKLEANTQKQNKNQNIDNTRNRYKQVGTWINIKRIEKQDRMISFLTPNHSYKKANQFTDVNLLLASSYTSRFTSKNSPTKLVQFRTVSYGDRNSSTQILRKTYFERTSRIFSPQKLETLKVKPKSSHQKQVTFYGKINQINHISGSRFKTLDPRFGGLTKEQIKQKIKKRANGEEESPLHKSTMPMSALASSSLNMYQIQSCYTQKGKGLNFNRYNFISAQRKQQPKKKRKQYTKDRYSPWNNKGQQVVWDELPKIKQIK